MINQMEAKCSMANTDLFCIGIGKSSEVATRMQSQAFSISDTISRKQVKIKKNKRTWQTRL